MQQSDDHTAWVLVPFEAVGPLRMGMTKAEVAATLAEAPIPLPTPPGIGPSPVTREAFGGAGVHVEYDHDGTLISVESVDRQVTYQGIALRRRLAADVIADLGRIGVDASRDEQGVGFDAPDLGLMFYVPDESDNEPPGTVLTVLTHRRDYAEVTGQ